MQRPERHPGAGLPEHTWPICYALPLRRPVDVSHHDRTLGMTAYFVRISILMSSRDAGPTVSDYPPGPRRHWANKSGGDPRRLGRRGLRRRHRVPAGQTRRREGLRHCGAAR